MEKATSRSLRANGHRAHNHVHRAGIKGIDSVGGFHEAEVHLIGITKNIAGNLAGDIYLEAAYFTRGGVAVTQQVIGTVHTHDEPAALDDVRHPFFRFLVIWAVAAFNVFTRGAVRGGGSCLFNLCPIWQRRARLCVKGLLGGRLQWRGRADIAGSQRQRGADAGKRSEDEAWAAH